MLKHFVLNNLCKENLISTFSQKSTYLIRHLETATQLRNWLWASKTAFISKPLTLELIVTVSFARFDMYWRPTVPRPNYNLSVIFKLSSHFYNNSMLLATCQRDLNTTCYAKLIGRLEASAESTLDKIWLFVPLTWRKLIPNKSHLSVRALTQLTGVTWPRSNMRRLAKPKQNGKPKKKPVYPSRSESGRVSLKPTQIQSCCCSELDSSILRYWFNQFPTCVRGFRRCETIHSSSVTIDLSES